MVATTPPAPKPPALVVTTLPSVAVMDAVSFAVTATPVPAVTVTF